MDINYTELSTNYKKHKKNRSVKTVSIYYVVFYDYFIF